MPKAKTVVAKNNNSNEKAFDQVIEIIQVMGQNHLAEIELETPEMKMTLKKHGAAVAMHTIQHNPVQMVTPQYEIPAVNLNQKITPPVVEEKSEPENDYHNVTTPMAGTFYRAPSPTSSPFANEGDIVAVGQTICIVEAMKMMNEIKADKAGKVVKIIVENGQPVEKGETLFFIGE